MTQDTPATSSLPSSRPMWFIMRGPGVHVPLVAVDELPVEIDLCGAPRQLHDQGASHLEYLGHVPSPGTLYALKTIPEHLGNATTGSSMKPLVPVKGQTEATKVHPAKPAVDKPAVDCAPKPSSHLSAAKQQAPINSVVPDSEEQTLKVPGTHQVTDVDAAQIKNHIESNGAVPKADSSSSRVMRAYTAPKLVTPTRRPLPPSGVEPDQSKKVYCTYWIRTGECDYMQAGCFYKHQMPDIDTLDKIGFRYTPKWWLDKQEALRLAAAREAGQVTTLPTGPKVAVERKPRGKQLAALRNQRQPARPLESRVVAMAASKRGRPMVPRTGFTPGGRVTANEDIPPPAPATVVSVLAKPQQTIAKLETNTTAVDEPLIALDIPVLLPITSTTTSFYANPPLSTARPETTNPKLAEPVHRFTSNPADLSPERMLLEETNNKMAMEAHEAAKDRRARLLSTSGVPARIAPTEDRTNDSATTGIVENGPKARDPRSNARRRGRRGRRGSGTATAMAG